MRLLANMPGRKGRAADNPLFHDHVARSADQDQMLDVIASDQDETAPGVDTGAVHDGQPGLPASNRRIACSGQPLDDEDKQGKQGQDDRECHCEDQTTRQPVAEAKGIFNPSIHTSLELRLASGPLLPAALPHAVLLLPTVALIHRVFALRGSAHNRIPHSFKVNRSGQILPVMRGLNLANCKGWR